VATIRLTQYPKAAGCQTAKDVIAAAPKFSMAEAVAALAWMVYMHARCESTRDYVSAGIMAPAIEACYTRLDVLAKEAVARPIFPDAPTFALPAGTGVPKDSPLVSERDAGMVGLNVPPAVAKYAREHGMNLADVPCQGAVPTMKEVKRASMMVQQAPVGAGE
jgi:hypothetical protein